MCQKSFSNTTVEPCIKTFFKTGTSPVWVLSFNSKFVERVPKYHFSLVVEVVGFVTDA